ncbi:class I SAM-dependent methyltransferase [Caenimonas sedimenti]|nr:class I SAM-dependent methyltransferase [Caenimonas sedimenti]
MKLLRKAVGGLGRALLGWPGARECVVCGKRLARFLPYMSSGLRPFRLPGLMQALEVVGSDIAHFSCPHCLSHDRERHLVLYLRAAGFLERLAHWHILHMAPEPHLARLIAERQPARYVRGDIAPSSAEIERIDLQQIPYLEASFDLAIVNHVMEHVGDDAAALRELARVLKPGGYAILQTPYSPMLESTFEDPGIRAPEARLQAYGQEDHVRLYGRDIFRRFAAVGLVDHTAAHEQVLPGVDPARYGVNAREPFILFRKPEAR